MHQVVEHVLAGLQGDGAGAWLDQGTEHPHRLALSVRLDRLEGTREALAEGFSNRGLQVLHRDSLLLKSTHKNTYPPGPAPIFTPSPSPLHPNTGNEQKQIAV